MKEEDKTPLEKAVEELEKAVAENNITLAALAALLDETTEFINTTDPCPYRGLGDE